MAFADEVDAPDPVSAGNGNVIGSAAEGVRLGDGDDEMPKALALPLALILATAPTASRLPRTEAETASEKPIVLPDVAAGRVAVLTVGFSKKSGEVTERWEKPIFHDCSSSMRTAACAGSVTATQTRPALRS